MESLFHAQCINEIPFAATARKLKQKKVLRLAKQITYILIAHLRANLLFVAFFSGALTCLFHFISFHFISFRLVVRLVTGLRSEITRKRSEKERRSNSSSSYSYLRFVLVT